MKTNHSKPQKVYGYFLRPREYLLCRAIRDLSFLIAYPNISWEQKIIQKREEQSLLRKYKEVKRKEVIFDLDEWKCVERLAKQADMTTSELIRSMTLNGKVVKVDMENVMPLVNAIRSVSNNINQIARMANETHSIYAEEVGRLREETLRLCRILNQYVSTLPSSAA